MTYLDQVQKAIAGWDAGRERSQQTTVGWSEVGGCRQALAFTMQQAWESDDTDDWRASVGTMLHEQLSSILDDGTSHYEVTTGYAGIPGHADHVDETADAVRDWKFPTVAVAESWQRDPEAFLPKRRQAHGYAAGLVDAHTLTEHCQVTVLVMPVDGGYGDWWEHTEPFNRHIADEAAARLTYVKELLDRGEQVPRDKPYGWCERFCEFFTLCRGADEAPDMEPLSDGELASMVDRYGELSEQRAPIEKERDRLKPEIRGLRGETPAGWQVKLTRPAGTKDVVDMGQVERDYAASGLDVPTRQVPTSTPSLMVSKPKKEECK